MRLGRRAREDLLKLLVIGNCQARPLAKLLAGAVEGVEAMEPIIVHLAREADAPRDLVSMAEADLILTQQTAATFKPSHLVSAGIRAAFADKTRVWPNIFYAGQQPDLKYLTHASRGRIDGPLDIYHDCNVLRAWYQDRLRIDPVPPREDPETVHALSLAALAERERDCDVAVSDLIEVNRHDRRLFFTFNHPARWLLDQMAQRLAKGLRLTYNQGAAGAPGKEPLGRIVPPALFDDNATQFQGLTIDPASGKPVGPVCRYTPAELRAVAFNCYDRQREALSEVAQLRYTPQIR